MKRHFSIPHEAEENTDCLPYLPQSAGSTAAGWTIHTENILHGSLLPPVQGLPQHIHFSFSCPKEELSKEMIKRFGRDFNKYDGNEVLFINTNGVNLEKINI